MTGGLERVRLSRSKLQISGLGVGGPSLRLSSSARVVVHLVRVQESP